jgi:hypothetical protein
MYGKGDGFKPGGRSRAVIRIVDASVVVGKPN